MDIAGNLIPQPAVSQIGNVGQAKGSQSGVIPASAQSNSDISRISEKSVDAVKDTEKGRLDRVRNGAQLIKRASGSSETFAIYRNGRGELVTRFTNRTNGTIRYIPEQSVVQFKESIDSKKDAIVDTQV